jgi:hypothetical protein
MKLEPSKPLNLPKLGQYRAEASRRRAIAFCDAPEYVLGTKVRPLTPATFTMLYAVRNAFVCGGQIKEHDVRNFLWFHSRLYGHCDALGLRIRKWMALRKFSLQLSPWWCRLLGASAPVHRYVATMAMACTEIQMMIDDAFADSPPSSGRPAKQIATTEAYLIHEFASAYGWAPEKTRHTPIRRLLQLLRCIRSARGEEIIDDGEDRILAEHLLRRNIANLEARKDSSNGG